MYNPEYTSYLRRTFGAFRPIIVIMLIVCLGFGLINGGLTMQICIAYCLIIFLAVLINSLYRNIYYLKQLDINEEGKTLKYLVVKFDNNYLENELKIEDLKARIVEKIGVYKTYLLEIKHDDIVIRQRTFGGWNTKLFIKVITNINEIQGKKTYLNYVRK